MAATSPNGNEMGMQRIQDPPFSIRLLERGSEHDADSPRLDSDQLLSLLPASYLTSSHDLVAPTQIDTTCVEKELDLCRLNSIHSWLWIAGRPMPPRPLHYQLLLSREIFVTEQMDMHLVWTTGRIFLKPIPRFLLEPRFWTEHLSAQERDCPTHRYRSRGSRERALGFLFSYAALISHESDFLIAKERHLLPAEVSWSGWRTFVRELGTEKIYRDIDPRFYYGELRLGRLNKIYRLSRSPLRGYGSHWNQYSAFFQDNFTWLAGATIYIALVLTAMQVGLATEALSGNGAFQAASYGFTVFSILGPLIAAGLIILAFCCLFVDNCVTTVAFKRKRLQNIKNSRSITT